MAGKALTLADLTLVKIYRRCCADCLAKIPALRRPMQEISYLATLRVPWFADTSFPWEKSVFMQAPDCNDKAMKKHVSPRSGDIQVAMMGRQYF
jgi:hypothetical protein